MWWHDAVVYQIYPRSFQDSDGDGVGDLRGIAQRLDHLTWLGVDALWMSPIYPSPLADFGYDVADHVAVDPVFGSLDDFDALVELAHARGIKVLMDLVPSHTSIEHPWFRDHPEWYIWSPAEGPANNWIASFGGSAWSRDPHGRGWYLHSYYPEQPDLNWRVPDVREAMAGVVRFWLERGVDGFRVDAIDRLVKDAELRDDPPASAPFALPLDEEYATLEHLYSSNSPEIHDAIRVLREAAGDALLVGEVFLPTAGAAPYLQNFDVVFGFELFFAPPEAAALRAAVSAVLGLTRRDGGPGAACVMSNHDFPRLPTRFGPERAGVAAMLLLTLPGAAFVYQGDEIGLGDGPGAVPPFDRAGRDGARHPMQWDAGPGAGFSSGTPWLAPVDPGERNVDDFLRDQGSLMWLYRRLIALRASLGGGARLVEAGEGVVAYERGESHVVALNFGESEAEPPALGEVVLATDLGALTGAGRLAPHGGVVARRP